MSVPIPGPVEASETNHKRQIRWDIAAKMLAHGHGMAKVAAVLQVSRSTVWRAVRTSRALQDMIAAEQAEMAVETGALLFELRGQVAAQIQQKLEAGDTRTVLWLAEKLGLVGPNALKHRELASEARSLDADAALKAAEALEFGEQPQSAEAVSAEAVQNPDLPPILTGPYLEDDETLLYHNPWSPFPSRVRKSRAANAPAIFVVPDWQIEEFRRTGVLRERAIPGEDQ